MAMLTHLAAFVLGAAFGLLLRWSVRRELSDVKTAAPAVSPPEAPEAPEAPEPPASQPPQAELQNTANDDPGAADPDKKPLHDVPRGFYA